MSNITEHWNREDLYVYTLLYCANADFDESIYEEAEIKAKYPTANYAQIHKTFDEDNDAVRAERILSVAKAHKMNKEDFEDLMDFIPTVIKADGHVSPEEEMMLHGLHELLNSL
ncbi:hypothetical protein [Parvicella tangerina]|uniref:Uncharacterized protein n=1 Tax=Parvicella tangerina TaxID=2829795 RepID=A0A916JN25_9FLAO|nr:hypothetical protein [Parvicella tangerina]CAG5083213.1 hypothetical protein CRYO30217_02124 [Parvicella tangerina]